MNDIRTRRLVWMLVAIGAFFVVAALVAWLWNNIVPWVIGFPPVTYWQAAGLLLLTRILFGGLLRPFGWAAGRPGPGRGDAAVPERVNRMTPEQRSDYDLKNRAFLNEVDDL